MKKTLIIFSLTIGYFLFFPLFFQPVFAVSYSLIAPTGTFTRGETYKFTINIDTQGATIQTNTIGMTYDTAYLEYVNTTPGNAMTSVSTSQSDTNKLVLDGTNTAGFSGSGVFAYVEFKLIAGSAGSTELCALWEPSGTPIPAVTSAPAVTNLPTSGATGRGLIATGLGTAFISLFGIFSILNKKIAFKKTKKK